MFFKVFVGVILPLIGTSIGAAFVFFGGKKQIDAYDKAISSFAGGVMTAASVWSLLIPALEFNNNPVLSVLNVIIGFLSGILFLIIADKKSEKIYERLNNSSISVSRNVLLQAIAVTLHNFPEGLAVGMLYSSYVLYSDYSVLSEAFILSLGIAIQNVPEGAIISMPLCSDGTGKGKAFLYGVLSGIVEPVGAIIAIYLSKRFEFLFPILLSFAAGAMMYVVISQVIPGVYDGKSNKNSIILYSLGFLLMMSLDNIFG